MTAVSVSPRRDDRDNAGGGAVAVWEQSDGYRYSAPAPTRRGKGKRKERGKYSATGSINLSSQCMNV